MDLKSRISFYKKKKLIREEHRIKSLAESYLMKARNNLTAMQLDYKISSERDFQKVLNISEFKQYDWVVIKGYYAMYMAALACLAKIGLKIDNHNAVVCALEFYFVKKGKLEEEYLEILQNVSLESNYVDDLKDVKEDRITAQYGVSEEFEKRKAQEVLESAKKFVDRFDRLFYEIK